MRSLRLDPELDQLVKLAAAREGTTVSEFLRRAAADRAGRGLAQRQALDGIVGAVSGGGGNAQHSGVHFEEMVSGKHQRR